MVKVLLIEDDETMRTLLNTLLNFEGFETLNLSGNQSMDDVIELIQQENPDLVMTDVNLHRFTGIDLLVNIRKHPDLCTTRVLMTSGMDFADRCKNAGADSFMLKPYMPEDLIKEIRHLVET